VANKLFVTIPNSFMKYLLIILTLALFNACTPESFTKRPLSQYTIEQFYDNKSVFGSSFSHDEKSLLVTSNESGIYNVYSLDLENGAMTPLTSSTSESCYGVSFYPNDQRFLYSSDQGGNEITHIFVQNEDGTTQDLTPWENGKSQFLAWTRDDQRFLFTSNKRDSRFFDLYQMDVDGRSEPQLIFQNNDNFSISVLSPDERYLALTKSITTSKNEMFLFNLQESQLIQVSTPDADASFAPQYFSHDNRFFYYLSDENEEFARLVRHNLDNGTAEEIFKTNWDVWYAYESYNGKYRVIGINEDGRTSVKVIDLIKGTPVSFPSFDHGEITSVSISRSEKLMRFSIGSSKAPSDLYLFDFETGEVRQLTNSVNEQIDLMDLVDGEVIRYPSIDGLEIPAIYYRPHQASESHQVPALVWVHGGPGGQSRLSYFPLIQYLVNHGYAVLAVNNRGSSGYGKTFYRMDDRKHGDVDLKDCVYAKRWLTEQNYIDGEKIGIIGGSYGGYMVMAAMAFEPEEFDVGVNIFGVTNWIRTLRSIPPYWESFREALYDELGDPYSGDSLRLYNISPLYHADQVTKPLLVLQGSNDPRVLQVESDEIVAAVRNNGVPVEYVLFEDEGHGFVKKENQIEGYGKVLAFLEKHLSEHLN